MDFDDEDGSIAALEDLSIDEEAMLDGSETSSQSAMDQLEEPVEMQVDDYPGILAGDSLAMPVDEGVSFQDDSGGLDFLTSLPYEVAVYIMMHADPLSICNGRRVCKAWRTICTDGLVWRDQFYQKKGWRIRPEYLDRAHELVTHESLELDDTPPATPSQNSIAHRIGRTIGHFLPDLTHMQIMPSPTRSRSFQHETQPPLAAPDFRARSRSDTTSTQASILHQRHGTFRPFAPIREDQPPLTPINTRTQRPVPSTSGRKSSSFLSPLAPIPSPYPHSELMASKTALNWFELYRNRYILETRWHDARQKSRVLRGHLDSVYCMQMDGDKLISGGRDHTVRVWDVNTGKCKTSMIAHNASVLALQYDERHLVTASSDATVVVWDVKTFKRVRALSGHREAVLDVRFDEQYIVSCSKDHSIRAWSRDDGEHLRTMLGHRGPVNAIRMQNGRVISASGDALLKLWDIETGETVRIFTGHARGLACVEWSENKIASGSNDHEIRIWNVNNGACLAILRGHTDLVRTLSFDAKSNRLLSGGYDKTVRLWDPETGEQLIEFRKGHNSLVLSVLMDVSRIISCSHDNRIVVLDFGRKLDVSPYM